MRGINATTGKALSGVEHLEQSIRDVLSTPIGSRIQRRDYGSRLPSMIDRPMNSELTMDVFAATAEALDKWEPRFKLTRVRVASAEAGHMTLDLEGKYLPDGKEIKVEGVVVL